MHRDAKIALGIIALVSVIACVPCILASMPAEENSIAWFRKYYGTSRKDLESIGRVYGVEPDDFSKHGPQPFPINYIAHSLGRDQSEPPTVYRSEVDSVIKGYVSECDLSTIETIYLFYSDRLSPKSLVDDKALVLSIGYELDASQDGMEDDQVLRDVRQYIVGDSGPWNWELVAPHCDPPARYVSCFQFFGYCIRIP